MFHLQRVEREPLALCRLRRIVHIPIDILRASLSSA
jgi:hypothetical protein